jgi:hypothetical protein
MKKSISLLAITAAFFAAGVFAAEKAAETKVANCCTKAKADGKTCSHACCVEAAKAGNNCTKCGGSGKIETTKK